jgi:predicted dehydrogenase
VKVIQVGIGGAGGGWIQTVQSSSEVEFAGFVEVDEAIAARQASRHNLDPSLIFNSLDKALRAVSADAVIVVTPPQFHRDYSLQALEAGLPVLSEKPLADTLEAAQEIVAASVRTGKLHAVSQNYRYRAPTQTIKRLLSSGELGRIGSGTVEWSLGSHFGGYRERMPYPMLIDGSIHYFDLMRFFLQAEPVSVIGRTWNPPWSWYRTDASASIIVEFETGVLMTIWISWCARQSKEWSRWRFECETGVLTLEQEKVTVDRPSDEAPTPVKLIDMERENRAQTLYEFYEAVCLDRPYATNCQDNIKSLAMVFKAIEACEKVVPVRFSRRI